MNKAFRKAAVMVLNNPNITNGFIQGCIDEYATLTNEQLLTQLKAAKDEFKAGGRGVELTDSIDSMRVAYAVRKVN